MPESAEAIAESGSAAGWAVLLTAPAGLFASPASADCAALSFAEAPAASQWLLVYHVPKQGTQAEGLGTGP